MVVPVTIFKKLIQNLNKSNKPLILLNKITLQTIHNLKNYVRFYIFKAFTCDTTLPASLNGCTYIWEVPLMTLNKQSIHLGLRLAAHHKIVPQRGVILQQFGQTFMELGRLHLVLPWFNSFVVLLDMIV